ncbi:MAG TPA: hypothetical protein ENK57_20460 [Polyangiaceae bacterium]|nr:hypothetical protein [Polyangiaceae bacterium]
MPYSVVINCDVCRVRGLSAAFDRDDETFSDLLTALTGAGWNVADFPHVFTCPTCMARGAGELASLIELREIAEAEAERIAGSEVGIYAAAWRGVGARIRIVELGISIPRTHIHTLEDNGQIVPIDTERLAARIVEVEKLADRPLMFLPSAGAFFLSRVEIP